MTTTSLIIGCAIALALVAIPFVGRVHLMKVNTQRFILILLALLTIGCWTLFGKDLVNALSGLSSAQVIQTNSTVQLPQTTFRLLVVLPSAASPDLAYSVATYVGGTVVQEVPELRVYDVEVEAHSLSEVEGLINKIKSNPQFAGITVTLDSPVVNF
jgi:hypothetical protein